LGLPQSGARPHALPRRGVEVKEHSSSRLPLAAGLSVAFLASALAVYFVFFRRAKRDLGF